MKLRIFTHHAALSMFAADLVIEQVRRKPTSLFCFATGSTPVLTYQFLAEKAKSEQVDFSKASFMGLDEWVEISPDNPGSCYHFLNEKVLSPLSIPSSNTFLFEPMTPSLEQACRDADGFIERRGGVDLMIVGIGLNGHIGFNEPGTSAKLLTHVAELHTTTTTTGQKYFERETVLKRGLTLGFGHILRTDRVFVLANGAHKADIVAQVVAQPATEQIPATILKKHPNAYLLVDAEAASKVVINLQA